MLNIYLLSSGMLFVGAILTTLLLFIRSRRLRVIFYRQHDKIFKVIKIRHVHKNIESVKFNNTIYILDSSKAILDKKNKAEYHFLIGNLIPLSFLKSDIALDSKILKIFIEGKHFKDMYRKGTTDKYMLILVAVVVVGLVIVSIFSLYLVSGVGKPIIPTNSTITI